jgi:hypothetical protein
MKAIKTLLVFFYGAFMASAIWIMVVFPTATNDLKQVTYNGWTIPIIALFILGCVIIFAISLHWLVSNWDER